AEPRRRLPRADAPARRLERGTPGPDAREEAEREPGGRERKPARVGAVERPERGRCPRAEQLRRRRQRDHRREGGERDEDLGLGDSHHYGLYVPGRRVTPPG